MKQLIELCPALHVYFDCKSQGWANEREKRVAGSLASIETKLYVQFIAFAVHALNSFNTALQAKAIKIGTMQQSIVDHLCSYLINMMSC